ncbi:MAG: hypothetical protein WBP55_10740, partial [Solirubrobacterales bacterium]
MGKRFSGLFLAVSLFLIAGSTGPGSASALTPPPFPEKASVVFSNAGRIVSMRADGSERQVLAARFAKVEATNRGYAEP